MLPLIAIRPQAFFMIPDWRWPLARIPVALVWIYEGLWGKILGGHPEQLAIASRFPGLDGTGAGFAIFLIGALECFLALWVLWGIRPRQAALVQTLLLAAMNAAGLLWAASGIPHPGQMLVMNLAFLTLVWMVAGRGSAAGKSEAGSVQSKAGSATLQCVPSGDASSNPRFCALPTRQPAPLSLWHSGRVDGRRRPAQLLFGQMYEDPAIEQAVFPAGCRVFSIASAGCTALSLASCGFEVTAVDVNPIQVEYLRRRLAGQAPCRGRSERLMACWRSWMSLCGLSRKRRLQFLMLTEPDQQLQAWRDWTPFRLWQRSLHLIMHPRSLGLFFSPAFAFSLPKGFGAALCRRLEGGWSLHPNRHNPFAWSLLMGCPPPGGKAVESEASPGWATLVWADAAEYLESCPAGSFGGFHLSNILDGATPGYARRLMQAVRRAAAPGARLVVRSLADPAHAPDGQWAELDRSMLWGAIRIEALGAHSSHFELEECRMSLLSQSRFLPPSQRPQKEHRHGLDQTASL